MKTRAQIALEAEAVIIGTPDNSDNDDQTVDSGYSTDSTMENKSSTDKGPRQYMPKEQMIQAGVDYEALDVITFRYYGAIAASKCGEWGDYGIGYAHLFDTTMSYRTRLRDPTANAPAKPQRPSLGLNPTKGELRQFNRDEKQYKEWCFMETQAKEMILEKFPRGCLHLLDSRTGGFSIDDSPKFILDEIQRRASTPRELNTQHGKLTTLMKDMEYTPTRDGPVEYIRDMILYMDRAHELLPDDNLPITMILNWMLAAFDRSAHSRVSLGRCLKDWNDKEQKFLMKVMEEKTAEKAAAEAESREPVEPDTDQRHLTVFQRFWIDELAELFRLEGTEIQGQHQAKLAHQTNMLSDEVTTVRALQATLEEEIRALKAGPPVPEIHTSDRTMATLGTTMTPEIQSALNALSLQFQNEFQAFRDAYSALATQPAHIAPQRGRPQPNNATTTARPAASATPGGWRQYKWWCYHCGVNISHESMQCRKPFSEARKHPNAHRGSPEGGNMKREPYWMKWYHPSLSEPQPTRTFPTN
jgi:hypothetical protein